MNTLYNTSWSTHVAFSSGFLAELKAAETVAPTIKQKKRNKIIN